MLFHVCVSKHFSTQGWFTPVYVQDSKKYNGVGVQNYSHEFNTTLMQKNPFLMLHLIIL